MLIRLIALLTIQLPFIAGSDICGIPASGDGKCKPASANVLDLVVITFAKDWTDSIQRYLRSGKVNGHNVKILGIGQDLEGGNRVDIVRKELEQLVKHRGNDDDLVVLVTDSSIHDTLLLGTAEEILTQFKMLDVRILFRSENSCWPNKNFVDEYPDEYHGRRCVNLGGYIGYASSLLKLFESSEIQAKEDGQIYFTKLLLDATIRNELGIKFDTKSTIFHVLDEASAELEMQFVDGIATSVNTKENTRPPVLQGHGATYHILNFFGNYLANNWNEEIGCVSCWEDMISISELDEPDLPTVLVAIFIERPIPFLEEFLIKIISLDYPKMKIHLFVHNAAIYHEKLIAELLTYVGPQYASVKAILSHENVKEWKARSLAVDLAVSLNCDYYLSVDGEAHLDHPHTLKMLIEQNRGIISPLLQRAYHNGSNFWGALNSEGFPVRSIDYMEIADGNRRGIWNVPYISGAYLVNKATLQSNKTKPEYRNIIHDHDLDPDMAFSLHNRNRGIFMYVSNLVECGHLINSTNFETHHKNNELYQLTSNQWDWELRYLHPNYWKALDTNLTLETMMSDKEWMPCPDVFWLPIVTPRFCSELIGEMENYGKWSDGGRYEFKHEKGYYDNAPTVDVTMIQVGLTEQWHEFLRLYVTPLQIKVFNGYNKFPPEAYMSFVVRYRPDEQKGLKPHFDTSTYTINIALNTAKVDFEGGGCRFTRYNCSIRETKLGYMLMHPGRLTHEHEGLSITKGTRYVLVSFVDPEQESGWTKEFLAWYSWRKKEDAQQKESPVSCKNINPFILESKSSEQSHSSVSK